jgi:CheY-like chemotaxis protein
VRLTVKDTGLGMSPEVREKAVEPFFTTKPMGKGTGLGLAMVFGTVKAHGGTLEILSSPGAGTEILLTFPARPLLPAAPRASQDQRSSLICALRILLVDDDELIRESLGPMLELLGHSVRMVDGGQAALTLFEAGLEVDLVILDMNMPGLNGAETLARLQALRPGQAVLMASGYSEGETLRMLSDRTGVRFIQKPFRMKEIQGKLTELALLPAEPGA